MNKRQAMNKRQTMNKRQAMNNMLTNGANVVSEQKRRHHQVMTFRHLTDDLSD